MYKIQASIHGEGFALPRVKYPYYFEIYLIRGGSRKKIEKKMIPSVPTSKNVYTKASMITPIKEIIN